MPALLVRARDRSGLGRSALAALAGTSASAISAYERGIRSPTVASLDRLLQACGLQLRVELEPFLADLDAEVDRLLAGGATMPDGWQRLGVALDGAGVSWAFDGSTALVAHGLGGRVGYAEVVVAADDATRTFLYKTGVDAVDHDGRIMWNSWLSLDLARAAPVTAFTRHGTFTVRVAALPSKLLRVEVDGTTCPVLGLLELEAAHPALADVLSRLRERRTVAS